MPLVSIKEHMLEDGVHSNSRIRCEGACEIKAAPDILANILAAALANIKNTVLCIAAPFVPWASLGNIPGLSYVHGCGSFIGLSYAHVPCLILLAVFFQAGGSDVRERSSLITVTAIMRSLKGAAYTGTCECCQGKQESGFGDCWVLLAGIWSHNCLVAVCE